eukprot:gene547-1962_t
MQILVTLQLVDLTNEDPCRVQEHANESFRITFRLSPLSFNDKPSTFAHQIPRPTGEHCVSVGAHLQVALEGTTLRALESVLTEVARVRCHGFHPREIARAMLELQSELENMYMERDKATAANSQEFEARLSKTLLPHITKEDVEKLAQGYHPHLSCVVKVVEHRQHCTDEDVRAVVERVAQAEAKGLIEPWNDGDVPEHLMTEEPLPGAIVSERTFKQLNATELTLTNGMRVCFKPTNFMEDEVMLTGSAFGGLSEVPHELFYTGSSQDYAESDLFHNGSLSSVIAGQLGVFGYKPTMLDDILAGKRVEMDLSEGAFMRSFGGVQSPADLETAFQLMHLLFTKDVKVDEKELDLVMKVVRQDVKVDEKELNLVMMVVRQDVKVDDKELNLVMKVVRQAQLRNPLHPFHKRVRFVNYGGCYYFEPIKLPDLEKVDPYIACAHHNMNYRNPEEFVVVLTGGGDDG